MIVDGLQITNTDGLFGNQTLEFAATDNDVSQFMGSAQLRFNTRMVYARPSPTRSMRSRGHSHCDLPEHTGIASHSTARS